MLTSNDTDVSAERSTFVKQRWSNWIRVNGFDPSHPEDDIKSGLRKLFSSCGEIENVNVTREYNGMRVAYLYIEGEDAAEKALKLSGSDVGGWNAVVTTIPLHEPLSRPRRLIGHGFTVGYLKPKKPAAKASDSSSSSEDESEDDSEDDSSYSDSEDDSSSSDSEDEKESEDEIPAQKRAKKENSRDDSSEESGEGEKKKRKMPSTEKTIFAYNLSLQIKRSDVEEFFKEAGEVVDVRFATSKDDGRFKGFGHVEFSTAEEAEKALDLHGRPMLGHEIGLVPASEVTSFTPRQSRSRFQVSDGLSRQTVYVSGFDFSDPVDDIKRALSDHFSSCGEISKISLSIYRDTKFSIGVAYIDFKEVAGACKALELYGSEMGGRKLKVNRAQEIVGECGHRFCGGKNINGIFRCGGWAGRGTVVDDGFLEKHCSSL